MKKLRKKIVIGVFISSTLVFAMTIMLFNLSTIIHINQRADSITGLIQRYNGELPPPNEYAKLSDNEKIHLYNYDEDSPYRIRYFVADINNDTVSADLGHIAAVSYTEAEEMAQQALQRNNRIGTIEEYRYRVTDNRERVIFLDCSADLSNMHMLSLLISLIALAFILMITVVFYFLSYRIVRPFEENARMQKQFITDASHELKTPLAIISANAEVLAYKDGENEWINNITEQVTRISELVNELLTLNRLEEVEVAVGIEPVPLSDIMNKTADNFAEVFNSKHVLAERRIEPQVVLNGNPSQLERLISVLVENASKYASENGRVVLTLKKEMRYTTMTVFNTCEIDEEADYKHLFDRFYRPDTSRTSKTGGHGIGLSIAKRIVTLHNGTIEAVPGNGGLTFHVKLSNKMKAAKEEKHGS